MGKYSSAKALLTAVQLLYVALSSDISSDGARCLLSRSCWVCEGKEPFLMGRNFCYRASMCEPRFV